MTNYVRRTGAQKKKEILAQREDELRHHIRQESGAETLERHSERVRASQLSVIKTLLYEMEPAKAEDHVPVEFRANLLIKRQEWLNVPVAEIIERYR